MLLFGAAAVRASRTGPTPQSAIYVQARESAGPALTRPRPLAAGVDLQRIALAQVEAHVPVWYGGWSRRQREPVLAAPTPTLPEPELTVEQDRIGGTRTLALRLRSRRAAPEMGLCVRSTLGLVRAASGAHPLALEPNSTSSSVVSAKQTSQPCDLVITILGRAAEGLPVTLEAPAGAGLDLEIVDRGYDDALRSSPSMPVGSMVVTRRVHLEPARP
jgi:hypothetical protein